MPLINPDIIDAERVAAFAKLEAVQGVAETLSSSDGVLCSNFRQTPFVARYDDKRQVTGVPGNTPQSLLEKLVNLTFEVELGRAEGSDVITPPACGTFLRCGGFDEIIETDSVDYWLTQDTRLQDSITFAYQFGGNYHLATGCKGSATIKIAEDMRLYAEVTLVGFYNAVTSQAFTLPDFTAYARSLHVNVDNVQSFTFGGDEIVLHSMDIGSGVTANRVPAANQKLIAHTGGVSPTASLVTRAPDVSAWNPFALAEAETINTSILTLGSAAGAIVEIECHHQVKEPSYTDDTPRKLNLALHPVPDTANGTTGTVIRFK